MKLFDLFPENEYQRCLDEGLLTLRSYPHLGLSIVGYSPLCQMLHKWGGVTTAARGIIFDTATTEILARPVKKMLNYQVEKNITLAWSEPVVTMDKVDGSLAIGYPRDGQLRLATRSVLESELVDLTHDLLQKVPGGQSWIPAGITPFFEVIHPETRVIVDYGQQESLVLLGGIVIETGEHVFVDDPRLSGWHGERVEIFPEATFAEAVAKPPRPGQEGLVVVSRTTGNLVKIKQADYLQLHKKLTALTSTDVHSAWVNDTITDLIHDVPDEMYQDISALIADLNEAVQPLLAAADRRVAETLTQLQLRHITEVTGPLRKAFVVEYLQRGGKETELAYVFNGNPKLFRRQVKPDSYSLAMPRKNFRAT